jgi:hypothetical protein
MMSLSKYCALIRLLFLFLSCLAANTGAATPLIALKEANNCGGCHNPGRSQRPVLWRRCTLDCQGCHIDPSGAGPRNQWGYYYSQDQIATVNFIKPIDPLQYTSRFDIHYDGRIIQRETSDSKRTFPMSSEISLRVRPLVNWLHLTYQRLYLGRIDDQLFRSEDERRIRDRYAVMVDGLPMNLYVKAGRSLPVYGLRRPNHSAWIRERLGLDQFATVDSVNIGGTPNVPFFHLSQMAGDPYALEEDRQKGTSFHGGLRGVTLGWHLNSSYWSTKSKKASIDMQALGLGANIFSLILSAERNWRTVTEIRQTGKTLSELSNPEVKLHPSSTISDYSVTYAGIPGVMLGVNWEALNDAERSSRRTSYVFDFHPIPNLQFEFWKRYEMGSRSLADNLAVLHAYFDL